MHDVPCEKDAEAMVTAMVDMEASYFDADFFRSFATRHAHRAVGGGVHDPADPTDPALSPDGVNGNGFGIGGGGDDNRDPARLASGRGRPRIQKVNSPYNSCVAVAFKSKK